MMTTVYAVLPGYNYEGFGDPLRVFATEAAAEAFAKECKVNPPDGSSYADVFAVRAVPYDAA